MPLGLFFAVAVCGITSGSQKVKALELGIVLLLKGDRGEP